MVVRAWVPNQDLLIWWLIVVFYDWSETQTKKIIVIQQLIWYFIPPVNMYINPLVPRVQKIHIFQLASTDFQWLNFV